VDDEFEEEPRGVSAEETAAVAATIASMEAGRFPQIVSALANPNFRLFWSGNFLSNIGTWMQNVALGWLVLVLTNSAFWLGVVGFAGSIPFLFFTLFGGVIADRVNKRRLLLVTQTIMMILAFLLAWLAWLKIVTVWEVVAISFLNGMALAMNQPSYQALVPQLVKRDDLTNAIALNAVQFNSSRVIGPSLGGYAMLLFGVAGNFFLNGLSFLAVIFALVRIRYPKEKAARQESMLASLRSGLRYVRGNPQMYVLVWMIGIASLMAMGFLTFIPYFARDVLHVGESGLGWLMACSGAGSVMGAVTVAWQGRIRRRGAVIAFGSAGVMASIIAFCYSHSFTLSCFMMLVEGYGMILTISAVSVAMQHLSSDEMRGRVMSIYGTCFLGLPPVGALLAGELSRHFATHNALAAMSAVSMAAFLGFYIFSRALRELD
jgi:predicted MFS family arabinose efflux permease